MLPMAPDSDRSLAAVLPRLLASFGDDAHHVAGSSSRRVVLIVVDGLGWTNLKQRRANARFLAKCQAQRLQTVVPSTTGAALTSLLTGVLPGRHGLLGYRQLDTETGRVLSTLTDWDEIADPQRWMRAKPLTLTAQEMGLRPVVIGRPAHERSGLTKALLAGAQFRAGTDIAARFEELAALLRIGETRFHYLYIDELDRAGHQFGWQSDQWEHALEELDAQLARFAAQLTSDVECVLTADHGIIDVPSHRHVLMDEHPGLLDGVWKIGGEPRFRHLYLKSDNSKRDAQRLAHAWREREGERSFIATRTEAIESELFGELAPGLSDRIGDVVVAARKNVAYYTSSAEDLASRRMVGQHGGISDDELIVPLVSVKTSN